MKPKMLLLPEAEPHRRLLDFQDHLQIIYKADQPPRLPTGTPGSGPPPSAMEYASWITLRNGPAPVDPSGHLYAPYAVMMYGLWSRERVADALPNDYRPED